MYIVGSSFPSLDGTATDFSAELAIHTERLRASGRVCEPRLDHLGDWQSEFESRRRDEAFKPGREPQEHSETRHHGGRDPQADVHRWTLATARADGGNTAQTIGNLPGP
jgi:hypothetical protein